MSLPTPEYAAERLLALGAMRHDEFGRVTGWPDDKVRATINELRKRGVITHRNASGGRVYMLRRQEAA